MNLPKMTAHEWVDLEKSLRDVRIAYMKEGLGHFANALERERKEISKQAIYASKEQYYRGYDQACKDIIKRLKAIGHKELKGL